MAIARARELRWNMTDAERRLWALLRRKKLAGFRFRWQAPIGPYFADFFCPKAALVVEVDGGGHGQEDTHERDEVRARWLQKDGCRVIRFWNRDVFMRPDEVIDIVYGALTQHPPSVAALAGASAATPSPRLRQGFAGREETHLAGEASAKTATRGEGERVGS